MTALVQSENSPSHHTEDGFRNPYMKTRGSFLKYLKMRYFGDKPYVPPEPQSHLIPDTNVDLKQLKTPGTQPQITWIGHATVLIQYKGVSILTDPMFSERCSPVQWVGPKRYKKVALPLTELPKIDFVVISHNHYDHLDTQTVKKIGNKATWLVPLKLKKWFKGTGVNKSLIHEFDWWDKATFDSVKITATPSQHFSSRTPWDRNETLWAAWAIQIEDFSFWFAGDTGYNTVQFKEIGEKLGPFNLAMIPIGAYEPRWFMGPVHVNPEESVQMHLDVRAKESLGIHWGTFILTSEPVDEPPKRLAQARQAKGLTQNDFYTLKIGETKEVNNE